MYVGFKDIMWKWDYFEVDDIFIDLFGKVVIGFMEMNMFNCYGGKLVVKFFEGLYFK